MTKYFNWEINISNDAPENFKSDEFKLMVKETAEPCIKYLHNKIGDNILKIECDKNKILILFKEIMYDMPILNNLSVVDKQGFIFSANDYTSINYNYIILRYNKWVDILITDTIEQIYRDIKLNKILENDDLISFLKKFKSRIVFSSV